MRVNFYATFRQIVGGKTIEFPMADGMTVRQLMAEIIARFPPLRAQLLDEQGHVYRHVHVLINGRDVQYLGSGLDTPVSAEDTVNIFPAVAGGAA